MNSVLARATGIVKRFETDGPPALDDVSISVEAGQITGLVGPDGSGKTTLIRILAGLIDPEAGEARIGEAVATRADRRGVGYMPQRFGLYEDLSVLENLKLHADLQGVDKRAQAERIADLLDLVSLSEFGDRLAQHLSGGMKQKLGLACALIGAPALLLLDEPGVGLDPISRRELWALIEGLVRDGIGVLWSTAYLDEAAKCDRIVLLRSGKVLFDGLPDRFTERVEGRVFTLPTSTAQKRAILTRALDNPAILDGVVQGDSLRFVVSKGAEKPAATDLGGGPSSILQDAVPRFEDAFIDCLDSRTASTSSLAKDYAQIPQSHAPAIEARQLTKHFGDFTAARDISFDVPRGQIFGLLGPNGAGKTTIFRMLCGLLAPSAGAAAVAGNDLRTARAELRQSLGYMSQQFSMYGHLSVRQNLEFFAGAYGLAKSDKRDAMALAVETFGLGAVLDQNSGKVPLGYKQRLSFACAVMHQPPVLFLDEPTSGVDPLVRREFWTHINGLVDKGVAVLVTTHFMEEAEYCDRIALIYRAEQIATGSLDDLKAAAGMPGAEMDDLFVALIRQSDATLEAA